jgi:hypothetical protein
MANPMSFIPAATAKQATVVYNAYADSINQQFNKQQSHYVNLKQRLRNTIGKDTYLQSVFDDTVDDFKDRHPEFKSWNDLDFPKALSTTLDKIVIDTTLQRLLMFYWVMGILDKFQEIKVMPIQVYEDPDCEGKYVCWDGQHTAIMLFVIATYVLKADITKCEIPIVVNSSKQKSQMRQVFMDINGDGKVPLSLIAFFHQMVFGVRTDGSKNPSWLVAEKKQQDLEKAKMFATGEEFNDTDKPGALTRLQELMDTKNYKPEITTYFTKYFVAVCRSSRAVQPKECWMLYEYFKLCSIDPKIEITDKYIRDVAKALKVVAHGDFDVLEFWSRAKASYQDYYRDNISWEESLRGIQYPEKRIGNTFLIAQIAKAGVDVPFYDKTLYPVPAEDLF